MTAVLQPGFRPVPASIAGQRPVLVPAFQRQTLHRHREARAILFLAGEMTEEGFEGRAPFRPGDVLFRPAHVSHADTAGPTGCAYVRLELLDAIVARVTAQCGWRSARATTTCREEASVADIVTQLERVAFEPLPSVAPESRAASQLARAPGVQVQRVSKALGLRPCDFTRRFARRFGVTPTQYRRSARVDRTVQLLVETDRTLADVAQEAGYHDHAHMTRDIVHELGTTPSALRLAARIYKPARHDDCDTVVGAIQP